MNLIAPPPQMRKLRHAARLAKRALPPGMPPVLVFTDPARSGDVIALANAIPAGWALVYRHFGAAEARDVAHRLRAITARRHIRFLVGADPSLAQQTGADGVHWPEAMAQAARRWAPRFALNTMSAHGPGVVTDAQNVHIDARVISTVFPSKSPSAGSPMGQIAFKRYALSTSTPLYALGGANAETAPTIARFGGFAAVGCV